MDYQKPCLGEIAAAIAVLHYYVQSIDDRGPNDLRNHLLEAAHYLLKKLRPQGRCP